MRLLRTLNEWTQTELACRLTEVGQKMSLSSISDIEKRKRRVDVDELVAFAAVLRVTPEALMRPNYELSPRPG